MQRIPQIQASLMNKKIGAIVAITDDGVLGNGLSLPWPSGTIKGDLPHFKRVTSGSSIVMGSRTHRSLAGPLPERVSYVVSSTLVDGNEGEAQIYPSLETALAMACLHERPIWIIGGACLLTEAMSKGVIDTIWITRVHAQYEGDVVLPWSADFLHECGYVMTHSEAISDGLATKEFWGKVA
jgi:dihydrofolate reductase